MSRNRKYDSVYQKKWYKKNKSLFLAAEYLRRSEEL